MPAEDASNKPKPKQNGWRALLRARRRREKREKRQEMMINHKPSLFRWPTRALPAVAGCRTEPHTVHKSNCRDASRLNHNLHAIDATPA